jgi:hypothetical protein
MEGPTGANLPTAVTAEGRAAEASDGGASAAANVDASVPLGVPPAIVEAPGATDRATPGARQPKGSVGYLTADSSPWAWVYLGGRKLDRTPFSRVAVPVGNHIFVFKSPETGGTARKKVRIREGKTSIVRVDLRK